MPDSVTVSSVSAPTARSANRIRVVERFDLTRPEQGLTSPFASLAWRVIGRSGGLYRCHQFGLTLGAGPFYTDLTHRDRLRERPLDAGATVGHPKWCQLLRHRAMLWPIDEGRMFQLQPS
jgi:hypothetical protein